jgi:hypothetical protein
VTATSKITRLCLPTHFISSFLSPSAGLSVHLCALRLLRLFPVSQHLSLRFELSAMLHYLLVQLLTLPGRILLASLPVSVRLGELTFASVRRTPSCYEYYNSSYELSRPSLLCETAKCSFLKFRVMPFHLPLAQWPLLGLQVYPFIPLPSFPSTLIYPVLFPVPMLSQAVAVSLIMVTDLT